MIAKYTEFYYVFCINGIPCVRDSERAGPGGGIIITALATRVLTTGQSGRACHGWVHPLPSTRARTGIAAFHRRERRNRASYFGE